MVPFAPNAVSPEKVAVFAASLVKQFGSRALTIANEQAQASLGEVAVSWRAIAEHIASPDVTAGPADKGGR